MTDNTDLVADARSWATSIRHNDHLGADTLNALADALAARDAACGHLPNELVARLLDWARSDRNDDFTDDELEAIDAATFQVTE